MRPGRIYTLTNPVGNIIFYVGSTSLLLSDRLSSHIYNGRNYQHGSVGRYIASLTLKPTIQEIESFDAISKNDLRACESYWIMQLKCWGFPLVNDDRAYNDCKKKMRKLTTEEVLFLANKKSYAQIIRTHYNIDIPENTLSYVIKRGHCTNSVYKKIQILISKLKELDYSRLVASQRIIKILLSDSQVEKIYNIMYSNKNNALREIGVCEVGLREILRTHSMRFDKYLNKQYLFSE